MYKKLYSGEFYQMFKGELISMKYHPDINTEQKSQENYKPMCLINIDAKILNKNTSTPSVITCKKDYIP